MKSLESIVQAQIATCPNEFSHPSLRWEEGDTIKVRIHSAFTSAEREIILSAFNDWNQNRFQNCSLVLYDTVNYTITDDPPRTNAEQDHLHWVEFYSAINRSFQGTTYVSASRPYAGTAIYGQMRNNSETWFKGLMMHEIGHSFGLNHAGFTCDTVMGGSTDGNNITSNDITTLRNRFCPMPTPTPTPTPTPVPIPECFQINVGETCPVGTYPNGYGMCCPLIADLECDPFCAAGFTDNGKTGNKNSLRPTACCGLSPIVVDIDGDGLRMSSASNGVMFDFNGDGIPHRISWTKLDSDEAWLVLDRNGNGLIDSSLEMFGNMTEQSESDAPNGFIALAEYDKTENGGNEDGKINKLDEIFSDLRLWQDKNHNGVSEPRELKKLPKLDVKAFMLDFRTSRRTDRHGNEFRYKAKVRDTRDGNVGKWAWDVFLVLDEEDDYYLQDKTDEYDLKNVKIYR